MTDNERGDDLASRAKMASLRLGSMVLGQSPYSEEDCLADVEEVTVFIQWMVDNRSLATPERVELLKAVGEVVRLVGKWEKAGRPSPPGSILRH